MRPADSARIGNVENPSGLYGMIIRLSDQLRCGKISLFEVDQEETEAAKACLEAKRTQRRERHAKNKKQINVKRRKTYALKKSSKDKPATFRF